MTSPVLEVRGLEAGYGPAQVLFGVSLELGRGEVAALLGRNGAGKSTTLRAILGLVPRRAECLRFEGQDILPLPTYRIARLGLGYVPEERRIFSDLTVAENLDVGRRPAPDGQEAWSEERLFDLFPNLAAMRHRPALTLSGGEQQMLAIARTLIGNPRAVLLDEPSEGLAPRIVEQMAGAIRRMKRAGIAVLVCEQNLNFALAVADRAYVLETGSISFAGTMNEVSRHALSGAAHLTL
jgi:branched-chain amino acid transport system ATP-binding protein